MDADLVYSRLADALAVLGDPQLDDIPEPEQLAAMHAVDDWFGPDPAWLGWLIGEVSARSGGATTATTVSDDHVVVKEPGAVHLRLVNGDRTRLAVLGRFVPPLQYEPDDAGAPARSPC